MQMLDKIQNLLEKYDLDDDTNWLCVEYDVLIKIWK